MLKCQRFLHVLQDSGRCKLLIWNITSKLWTVTSNSPTWWWWWKVAINFKNRGVFLPHNATMRIQFAGISGKCLKIRTNKAVLILPFVQRAIAALSSVHSLIFWWLVISFLSPADSPLCLCDGSPCCIMVGHWCKETALGEGAVVKKNLMF